MADDYLEREKREYTEKLDIGVQTAFTYIRMSSEKGKTIYLKDYLYSEKQTQTEEMTPDEWLHVVRLWNAAMGGKEVIN